MKIKAVFFDLGKVLLDFDLGICFRKLGAATTISEEKLRSLILTPRMNDLERGIITTDEYFSEIRDATGFPGSVEDLRVIFNDIFDAMDENIMIAHVISEHMPIGLISNTNAAHVNFVEARYDFFSRFSVKVYSHETGLRKPEPEIYHRALNAIGIRPEESIFIDDLSQNTDGARAVGIHAIHLPPGQDLRRGLAAFPDLAFLT